MPTRIEMMAQRVGELERQVGGFSGRFDAIDEKFNVVDQRFDAIDQKFDAIDQKFDAIDQKFEAIDQKFEAVDRRLDELPTKTELRAFLEEMTSRVTTAAEGFGGTLDALRRDIKRLSVKITTRDRDVDLVLKDHGKRIGALERR